MKSKSNDISMGDTELYEKMSDDTKKGFLYSIINVNLSR